MNTCRTSVLLSLIMLTLGAVLTAPIAQGAAPVPIEHVIVLMQENHSFDNYFGIYPGADGFDPATCVPVDPDGVGRTSCIKPFYLAGRTIEPLNYDARAHQRQARGGSMNGFVDAFRQVGKDGTLAMGYYDERDLPFYWNLADDYVLFDRFFSAAPSGSIANRMFWVSGVPGSGDNRIPSQGWGDIPTIFDQLEERGVSWKFYVQNYDPAINVRSMARGEVAPQVARVPLLAFSRFLDNPKLASHIVDLDEYKEDLRRGSLPAVAYIAPAAASERPPGSIQAGQRFVKGLLNELMRSDAWYRSAFFLTYDDTGGWYDHVAPPQAGSDSYGFRVPALLVSPYARKGYIESTTLDSTAILKFIEDLHGLAPLSSRDAGANSLLAAFDFAQPPRAPAFVPFTRGAITKPEPRRDVIYICYSAALVIAGLIIGGAALSAGSTPGSGAAPASGRQEQTL
jgi:phospholipase C